jgi:hypothetical protein
MPSSESNNCNTIEVDSILFETLVPVQTIQVPQREERVSFHFGVHIMNQSSTPYRFHLPGFIPELVNRDGQLVGRSRGSNAHRRRTSEDFPLIDPGGSKTYWTDVELFWLAQYGLCLSGYVRYGTVWQALNLQPDDYQLQYVYSNHSPHFNKVSFYTGNTHVCTDLHNFWVGTVCTPFVKLCLVQP